MPITVEVPDDVWKRLVRQLADDEMACLPGGPGNLSRYEKSHWRSAWTGARYVLHQFGLLTRYDAEAQAYAETKGLRLKRGKPWSTLDLVDVAARKRLRDETV